MYNIEIEFDPQSEQYYVIDPRPGAIDRFHSQHDSLSDAESARDALAKEIEQEMPW